MRSGKRILPQMALSSASGRKRVKVLESRHGKLMTVMLDHGGRVRIRLEEWGMSVSVLDVGQESGELSANVAGLCQSTNLVAPKYHDDSGALASRHSGDSAHSSWASLVDILPEEFCDCPPNSDAYLAGTIQQHHNPK